MKRICIYLAVTFPLTWALWGLATSGPVVTGMPMATQLMIGLGMMCPATGVLVTWLILRKREPFSLPLRPKFRGNAKSYLLAWFGPSLAVLAGGLLYFLVFRNQLDPSMGFVREMGGSAAALYADGTIRASVILQIAVAVLLGPLINVIAGAGEEIGWRGLLYPALREKLSPAAACLMGGVIWGLWHAPVTMRGHNYGLDYPGFPWLGVLAMCVFCIAIGTLLHYLTIKSGSIWPASLAHAGFNALAAAPMMFLPSAATGSRLLGPSAAGLLAGLPLLMTAVAWMVVENRKMAKPVPTERPNP